MRRAGVTTATVCLCAAIAGCTSGGGGSTPAAGSADKHVVLVSVDGMHESDLAGFVAGHPDSTLAKLVARGVDYTAAQTPVPTDSFPGLLAQLTGGTPKTTGVYYDDSYAHDLVEAGTTNCTGAKPGAAVSFTEELDKDTTKIDGGQGLPDLPDGVMKMTSDPTTVIDQAPMQPASLNRIDDGAIIDDINAEWAVGHPDTKELIVHSVNDDAMIMWLADRSPEAAAFVKDRLSTHNGVGVDIAGKPKPFTASGTEHIYAGADAATFFGTTAADPRVPDIYASTQPGTVYTSKTKIAEHGGDTPADRNVPLVVAGSGIAHRDDGSSVGTAQIAPTILKLLDLDPKKLQAVVAEGTQPLPSI